MSLGSTTPYVHAVYGDASDRHSVAQFSAPLNRKADQNETFHLPCSCVRVHSPRLSLRAELDYFFMTSRDTQNSAN